MYRSKKYLDWIRKQLSAAPYEKISPDRYMVAAHQRLPNSCGTGIKPPDTFALPLTVKEHNLEHMGSDTFWQGVNRAGLCMTYVCRYLEENHNIDSFRLILDLVTQYMEENKL